MALGAGDRSTVELLLEITGRSDASSAAREAEADMARLSARSKEFNELQKEQARLSKVNNDLRKAALDIERMERSQDAYNRSGTRGVSALNDPDKAVAAMSRIEQSMKRIKQVQDDAGKLKWIGMTEKEIDGLKQHIDAMNMSFGEFGRKVQQDPAFRSVLGRWGKDFNIIGDRLQEWQGAQERVNEASRDGAVQLQHLITQHKDLSDRVLASSRAISDAQRLANSPDNQLFTGLMEDLTSVTTGMDKQSHSFNQARLNFDAYSNSAEKAARTTEKVGRAVEHNSNLTKAADFLSNQGRNFGGSGLLGRGGGSILGLPLRIGGTISNLVGKGLDALPGETSSAARGFQLLAGAAGTLAGVLVGIPAVVGLVVAAIVLLEGVLAAAMALFVAFIPPVTLLVGLLGGLGAAFAYIGASAIKNAGGVNGQEKAVAKLHETTKRYNADVLKSSAAVDKYGAGSSQAQSAKATELSALSAMNKAQQDYNKTQIGAAIGAQNFEKRLTGLRDTLTTRFTPALKGVIGGAGDFVKFLNGVAKLPTDRAFTDIAHRGVNMIYKDFEGIGHTIGPIIRDAFNTAFSDSGNLRSKMVTMWNQIVDFFGGKNGVLIPAKKWFDSQHIMRTAMRWVDEFNTWISNSGVFDSLGKALLTIVENAFKEGIKAGISAGVTELTTAAGLNDLFQSATGTGGKNGGSLTGTVITGTALGLAGRLYLARGGASAAEAAAARAAVFTPPVADAAGVGGAADVAGGIGLLGTAGAIGLAGAPLLAALGIPFAAGMMIDPNYRTSLKQLRRNEALITSPGSQVDMARQGAFFARAGNTSARGGGGVYRTRQQIIDQNFAAQKQYTIPHQVISGVLDVARVQNLSRNAGAVLNPADISAVENHILGAMSLHGPNRMMVLNRARVGSQLTGAPLAPNQIRSLAQVPQAAMGGVKTFMEELRHMPSHKVIHILVNHAAASTAIAALMGQTHKLPTKKQLKILTDIPQVAIPAVKKLIDHVHGMPTKKELQVTVKGAEVADAKTKATAKKLMDLKHRAVIEMKLGGTVSTSTAKAIQKLESVKTKAHTLFQQADFVSLGNNIDAGVASGITSNAGQINAAMTTVVNNAIKAGIAAAEAKSPSRKAARVIGVPLGQGITVGLMKEAGGPVAAMKTILESMLSTYNGYKDQFTTAFGTLFQGPGGTGLNAKTGFATRLTTLMGFPGAKIPFSAVRGDLSAQLQTFKKFNRSLIKMRAEGYPEALIQQLIAIGPSAQGEIDALTGANRKEKHQYIALFNDAQKAIGSASKGATSAQINLYKGMGRGVAFGILTGLKGAEPQIESYLRKIAEKMFDANHKKFGTSVPDLPTKKPKHSTTHKSSSTSHKSEASGTTVIQNFYGKQDTATMKKAAWYYQNVTG